jgi:hypothetical protein
MINHELLDPNFISDEDEPTVVMGENSYFLHESIAQRINEILAPDNIQLVELTELYTDMFKFKSEPEIKTSNTVKYKT